MEPDDAGESLCNGGVSSAFGQLEQIHVATEIRGRLQACRKESFPNRLQALPLRKDPPLAAKTRRYSYEPSCRSMSLVGLERRIHGEPLRLTPSNAALVQLSNCTR